MSGRHVHPNRTELEGFAQRVLQCQAELLDVKQAALAQKVGLSQGTISRILSGEVLPGSPDVAEKIADELRLIASEKDEWLQLLFGMRDFQGLSRYSLLEQYQNEADFLSNMRLGGGTTDVITMVNSKAPILRHVIRQYEHTNIENDFRTVLAKMLLEQACAYAMVCMDDVVGRVQPIYDEVIDLARRCRDKEMEGMAEHHLGLAYYIDKNYVASTECYAKALNLLSDENNRLWSYRAIVLNTAYLNMKTDFNAILPQVRELLTREDELKPDIVCLAYESIGRGIGILGLGDPFEEFHRAERAYQRMCAKQRRSPFRLTQMTRSQLEAVVYTATEDKAWLEPRAREITLLAREVGYKRHALLIEKMSSVIFA